jgi:hypothetical protein
VFGKLEDELPFGAKTLLFQSSFYSSIVQVILFYFEDQLLEKAMIIV